MFWLFSKEKRTLRSLIKLCHRTIARMELLLPHTKDVLDRAAIAEYLASRRRQLDNNIRYFYGRGDELDDLVNPVRTGYADNLREAMILELRVHMTDPHTFADYLDDIRPIKAPPKASYPEPAFTENDRQSLKGAGWSDDDIDVMSKKQRAAELREIAVEKERASGRERRREP